MRYTFSLILVVDDGARPEGFDYAVADALFEQGCDDATFSVRDGVPIGDFDREAETAITAIRGAIDDVESVAGIRAHHVEPGELVSSAQIAERIGRSRQNVQQLTAGDRGPATFPTPISGVTERTRLWRWHDVVDWWESIYPGDLPDAKVELAHAIAEVNKHLDRRPVGSTQWPATNGCPPAAAPSPRSATT